MSKKREEVSKLKRLVSTSKSSSYLLSAPLVSNAVRQADMFRSTRSWLWVVRWRSLLFVEQCFSSLDHNSYWSLSYCCDWCSWDLDAIRRLFRNTSDCYEIGSKLVVWYFRTNGGFGLTTDEVAVGVPGVRVDAWDGVVYRDWQVRDAILIGHLIIQLGELSRGVIYMRVETHIPSLWNPNTGPWGGIDSSCTRTATPSASLLVYLAAECAIREESPNNKSIDLMSFLKLRYGNGRHIQGEHSTFS